MLSLVCEKNNQIHDAHVNRAKMYILKGQDDVAMHEYLLAHHIDSKNIDTIESIISICEKTGEKHTAGEFYEKLLKIEPNNGRTLLKSGDFYADMGEFQVASEYYEKACEILKTSDAYLKTGKCFEKLKREKIARDYYEKYLVKAPAGAEKEVIKVKIDKLSNVETSSSDEDGFLEKILGLFSKK